MTLQELINEVTFKNKRLKQIKKAEINGKVYLRYSCAHLRLLRAERGVGRPVK